jgi:CBS domain-containing protein
MAKFLDAKPRVGYYLIQNPDTAGQLDHLLELKVGEVQSHPVVILESSSVYNAIVTLFLEDVGTLFVDDNDGYLVGIVSRKDLLKSTIGETDIRQLPVGVIMNRMAIVTRPDETIYTAVKKLVDYRIDALPVVLEEKVHGKVRMKVIGRFSKTTLTNTLISECTEV